MSFPNLTPTPSGVLHASATGVPVNGVNVFDIGINIEPPTGLTDKDLDDWITIRVWALGASVTAASYIGRAGNLISVAFTQSGADQCFVEAEVTHSAVR
jgi:hypothetical protein